MTTEDVRRFISNVQGRTGGPFSLPETCEAVPIEGGLIELQADGKTIAVMASDVFDALTSEG